MRLIVIPAVEDFGCGQLTTKLTPWKKQLSKAACRRHCAGYRLAPEPNDAS
ncbi:hypothetical protein Bra5_PB00001 (plasmid) [Rhizobium phaseoli Brasil 5]|nr:hypothetical protein Bra5_PB00001 [Rhizobium phaseoli Brasil 5]